MKTKTKTKLLKKEKIFIKEGDFEDFFQKIKTISALFMHQMEIENLDETTVFLIEAIDICIKEYEGENIWN